MHIIYKVLFEHANQQSGDLHLMKQGLLCKVNLKKFIVDISLIIFILLYLGALWNAIEILDANGIF
ncbi:hypothetical protein PCNPT3_11945 [Psychromonas sp. CNPT3]|nr:hypothetical protein PCNPT3_11945 [Psychromonas sp. CNPT3]